MFVPVRGVEPLSRAYESLVLAVELHWHRAEVLREPELHRPHEVMGLVCYYYTTPRSYSTGNIRLNQGPGTCLRRW